MAHDCDHFRRVRQQIDAGSLLMCTQLTHPGGRSRALWATAGAGRDRRGEPDQPGQRQQEPLARPDFGHSA